MTTVTQLGGGTAATASTASSNSTISSDFTTFLKMLTTQMQNQDPTDPIESSDYAAQLANFSQVEQQVKTNDLLTSISGTLGLSGLSQYANWVGKEVRAVAATNFDGATPISAFGSANVNADQAILIVENSAGQEISRTSVPTSESEFEWDGKNDNGETMPMGIYTLKLESYEKGSLLSTESLATYNRVVEARAIGSAVEFVLETGALISSGGVSALR